MAAERFPLRQSALAALLVGTALCGAFSLASPAFSQETVRREIVEKNEDGRVQLTNEDRDVIPDRDRLPLGQSPSIFLKPTDEMTTAERELMRELYQEGDSVDRLDDDDFGRMEPQDEARKPPSQEFDIFAGPSQAPTPSRAYEANDPATAASPTAGGATATNADDAEAIRSDLREGRDALFETPGSPAPENRAEPISRDARGGPSFTNTPLSAGVAGEVLSSDSLLEANDPARALERIVRRPSQANPFDAVGLRAGSVTLYPELYQGAGISSNIDKKAGGESGAFSRTELNLKAITDWSRHSGELNGRLTYRRNFGGEEKSTPEASVDGQLQLDLGDLTTATLRGAMAYRRDDEIDLGPDLRGSEPEILDSSLSAELARDFGRSTLTGGVTLAREHYLSKPVELKDPGYTTATARLRAAYGLSPAFKPFVEASLGRRFFDEAVAAGDYATIPALRAGVAIDLAEKIRGEVALGYALSVPEDGDSTGAPTFDANLIWSPQRGTDVVLETRTTFDPDGAGGSSANYNASIGVLHALNNRFDINGALRAELETDDATANDPLGLAAEIGFTYWINRSLSFTGLYEYETRFETDPADDWASNTVSLGIRLRR